MDQWANRPTFYYNNEKQFAIRAGGLMFYRLNKKTKDIDLLLIENEGQYEDFGGRTDEVDKSAEDTISREVEEESNKIFSRELIKKLIQNEKPLYTRNGKYLLYICQITDELANIDPVIFGNKEFHDNIYRVVEWVPYQKFKTEKFQKKVNFRLKFRDFDDKLVDIYKKHFGSDTKDQIHPSQTGILIQNPLPPELKPISIITKSKSIISKPTTSEPKKTPIKIITKKPDGRTVIIPCSTVEKKVVKIIKKTTTDIKSNEDFESVSDYAFV